MNTYLTSIAHRVDAVLHELTGGVQPDPDAAPPTIRSGRMVAAMPPPRRCVPVCERFDVGGETVIAASREAATALVASRRAAGVRGY